MTIYSHSRLSTFEKCPRAYKYKYLDKIKPEIPFIGIEAFMGSTVHESLEYLYRFLKKYPDQRILLIQLLEKYENIWNENWSNDVKIVKEGMKKEDYFLQGKKILSEYYQEHQPFTHEETLSIEERIDINIEGFRLMGFVDRLALSQNGVLKIYDYKTSGKLPDPENLKNDRQLSLYQIGIRKKYPQYAENEIEIVYHYLAFNKEFKFQKNNEEIETVKKNVIDLIQTIEFSSWTNDFPARVGTLCRWCEFSSLCPDFKSNLVE